MCLGAKADNDVKLKKSKQQQQQNHPEVLFIETQLRVSAILFRENPVSSANLIL